MLNCKTKGHSPAIHTIGMVSSAQKETFWGEPSVQRSIAIASRGLLTAGCLFDRFVFVALTFFSLFYYISIQILALVTNTFSCSLQRYYFFFKKETLFFTVSFPLFLSSVGLIFSFFKDTIYFSKNEN